MRTTATGSLIQDQSAHLVPGEVFQEAARDHHLRARLRVVLGRHALDQPREVVLHLQASACWGKQMASGGFRITFRSFLGRHALEHPLPFQSVLQLQAPACLGCGEGGTLCMQKRGHW